MDKECEIKAEAAQRWIKARLEHISEEPGGETVLQQPSFEILYQDYLQHVARPLQWQRWRVSQELPRWVKRYLRRPNDGRKFATVHYAGVRLKA